MSEKIYDRTRSYLDEVAELGAKYGTDVRLMGVTKFRTEEEIAEVLRAGIRLVGENRPQEFRDKYDFFCANGVEKHMIGNLQKNKLKYVVGKADVIESVNSLELAEAISDLAARNGIVQDVLIEVNAGAEESKQGFEVGTMMNDLEALAAIPNIRIRGLMTMAPKASDAEVEKVFDYAHKLFIDIKEEKLDNISMDIMSMGMSNDFRLAIKHGSNLVRIGRALFDDMFNVG